MQYYNVLSNDGLFTIQHGRYTDLSEAENHAERLRSQGIDAYVTPWRSLA